ncbi:hypothetical protein [Acidovorax sp. Root219]|uniref:hypothetical protein n=1 Tax=Acidovorax sp. Root219 TaxID=1736493 RepID=UPI00070E5B69|nr:hypothetical protein [Acidovorax sp. Root219]KRC18041.1 hypothetical protein ASE28_04455 [Acidovorax sp. Root219]
MLATVVISTFTILIIIGLLAAIFLALRDARRKSKNKAAENQPPPQPPHPLEWLLHLLLAFMFAGIGAWHFAHPDEIMGGGAGMAVILGLAYLALGKYGPGIAALAAAAGFLAACVWRLRSQD